MERKLYKSRNNRQLAGVCGGIGEYFNIDPVIVRLLVVAFTLAGGAGLIAYIIGMIIIPERKEMESTYEYQNQPSEEEQREQQPRGKSSSMVWGFVLIGLGGLLLLRDLLPWIPGEYIFSAILIALGVYLIVRKPK